jgi:hypothetical protein
VLARGRAIACTFAAEGARVANVGTPLVVAYLMLTN